MVGESPRSVLTSLTPVLWPFFSFIALSLRRYPAVNFCPGITKTLGSIRASFSRTARRSQIWSALPCCHSVPKNNLTSTTRIWMKREVEGHGTPSRIVSPPAHKYL